ncbi:MFS transporter [Streptomyces boninensis]|uniref:MFS transporter n=1 Tax=Streptomyces boninensis TaxID=2039455 RepID=UPI003B21964F
MKRYLATAVCARLADDGMPVAVALLSLARTGGAGAGAAVLAAWMVPHVVAAPLAGALAARARRPGWFYAPALLGFAGAIAVVTAGLGAAPTPLVVSAAALGGACGPAVTGGLSSLLSGLPPGGRRERAYALDAATYNVAGLIAPAAVTVAATTLGASWATLLLATSALLASALATSLPRLNAEHPPAAVRGHASRTAGRVGPDGTAAADATRSGRHSRATPEHPPTAPEHPPAVRGQASRTAGRVGPDGTAPADATGAEQHSRAPRARAIAHEMRTGITAIARTPPLRTATLATSLAYLGIGGLALATVLLGADRDYPGGGGTLLTCFAVGALTGSAALTRWTPRVTAARLAAYSLLGTGAALAAAALTAPYAACLALFALAGACDGPLLTATLRIRADHAPPGAHAQVFTVGAGLKVTAGALGAALVGIAAGPLPPYALLLAIAALQPTAAALLLTRSATTSPTHPSTPPPQLEQTSRTPA